MKKLLKKKGYLALVLDKNSVSKLKEKFPPRYEKIFYHHVTIEYKPNIFTFFFKYKRFLNEKREIKVIEKVYDEKAEALIVKCPLSKNNIPHISLSTVKEKMQFILMRC